ncbi:MAG: SCO family protein [Parvularculaceae bacterium]|nr:SCO family protein [Parvularculaceae bacterium]
MSNNRLLLIGLAAGFLSAAACGARQASSPPQEGLIRLSDQFSADFALIDQDGRLMRDEDLKGKAAIVYFGFATCPDVCPLALGRLTAALNVLTDKEREKVIPLFITVDPDRDTPAALKTYLAFDPRIIGLTGERGAIEQAKAGFKVYAEPEPIPGSEIGYTMNHSSLFYLIEPDGKLRYALQDTLTPPEIAAAIRAALS